MDDSSSQQSEGGLLRKYTAGERPRIGHMSEGKRLLMLEDTKPEQDPKLGVVLKKK